MVNKEDFVMLESRATITSGGRLVIPSIIRKELHLNVGQEVILTVESGELHVVSLEMAIMHAQNKVKSYNKKNLSLAKELIASRKEESKNE